VADDAADPKDEDLAAEKPADPVLDSITALHAAIDDLTSQVTREHDRAKAREAVIDRLHEETQRLRAGEARELLRPVLADLRRLRDDLLGQSRSVPGTMPGGNVAILLESYADSVMMILERYDIVAVRPEPRMPFDPHRHCATGTIAAPERQLDGMIATVLSDGYEDAHTGAMIVSARVIVYRHAGAEGPDGQGG
jgi:molecular chaperone GrpE (heat shock protein)